MKLGPLFKEKLTALDHIHYHPTDYIVRCAIRPTPAL